MIIVYIHVYMYYVLRICEQDKENVGVTCAEEDGLSVDDDE